MHGKQKKQGPDFALSTDLHCSLNSEFSLSTRSQRNTKSAFFYSQFWNENGQNVKCARSFIPHSHSGMDRTPFHPFCSQEQNERNVANENQRWRTAGRVLSIQTRPYRTYRRKNLDILLGKMKVYFLSHYTKRTRRISVMFPTRKMIADDMKKSGYSPSATNCENRWKCLTSSFRKCEDNNNKSGRSRHICYAMFTPARFVTQCLLVPGPRIPTGVFLYRQSELFRAFCSNHSYSRIVGKKTRPKCPSLRRVKFYAND